MKTNLATKSQMGQRLPVEFGPEVEFDATPSSPVKPEELRELFSRLQDRLVQQCLDETASAMRRAHLVRAAQEAAALAWTTPYPLLVMPSLLEEKIRTARLQAVRQIEIQWRSERFMESTR